MTKSLSIQLANSRKEKTQLLKQLDEDKKYIERLQKVINGDVIVEWKIPEGFNQSAGINIWTWPLYQYLNFEYKADIRNKACAIMFTVLRQFIAKTGFGIDLPFEVMEIDYEQIDIRKKQMKENKYPPCVICGFDLITAECHIIPRCYAGPNHIDNYLFLCPNHHHLFDHHRLSKPEFDRLLDFIKENKSKSSYIFALQYHAKLNGFPIDSFERHYLMQGPFLS